MHRLTHYAGHALLCFSLLTDCQAQFVSSSEFSRGFQQRCIQATTRLWIYTGAGTGSCSGAIVGSDANGFMVVSSPHCFANDPQQIVVETFGSGYPMPEQQYDQVTVLCEDEASEFALLHVRGLYHGPTLPLAPRGYSPSNGDQVLSVGCGGGSPPTCEVNRLVGHNREQWTVLQKGTMGRSGGPLISKEGYVLGACCCTDGRHSFYSYTGRMHRTLDQAGLTAVYEPDGHAADQRVARHNPDPRFASPDCPQCPPGHGSITPDDIPVIVRTFPFGNDVPDFGPAFVEPQFPGISAGHGSSRVRIFRGTITVRGSNSGSIIVGPEGIFIDGRRVD